MKVIKVIRDIFNHGRLYIFLCLCGIVLISITRLPCFGMGIGHSEPVISVTSTNEPSYRAFAKISKDSGYRIEITKGWENKSITVNIKNSSLEESIKTIIRSMGEPSHAVIRNDRAKKIEIRIFDAYSGSSSYKGAQSPKAESERVTIGTHSMEGEEQGHSADREFERHQMEMEAERQSMEREAERQRIEMEAKMQQERQR